MEIIEEDQVALTSTYLPRLHWVGQVCLAALLLLAGWLAAAAVLGRLPLLLC